MRVFTAAYLSGNTEVERPSGLFPCQYSGWAIVEPDVIRGKRAVSSKESMNFNLDYLNKVISSSSRT